MKSITYMQKGEDKGKFSFISSTFEPYGVLYGTCSNSSRILFNLSRLREFSIVLNCKFTLLIAFTSCLNNAIIFYLHTIYYILDSLEL